MSCGLKGGHFNTDLKTYSLRAWCDMTATEIKRPTRAERVDPRLRASGWISIVPFVTNHGVSSLTAAAVAEYPTTNGPANYALCYGGTAH